MLVWKLSRETLLRIALGRALSVDRKLNDQVEEDEDYVIVYGRDEGVVWRIQGMLSAHWVHWVGGWYLVLYSWVTCIGVGPYKPAFPSIWISQYFLGAFAFGS
jgi:hypothetical protein